ncbi:LOW QUALITY PROTEIN: late secretory pathway protein AVL9 homolog [Uloborus diversus]|uniref:LOW QUALITY PROTEIN: late secretory pathway protein AVL9 homolog n=1 Tax=Uloborus diversus TaxID=327109 RepID=UPI002409B3E4|nr:LOW QUALITY PROTEIN: late secretory pathway protein AVL9 homolog [Uloborus diversus]
MSASADHSSSFESPIIHVFVVGFHHKKGCVVEYSYPPVFEEDNIKGTDLPEPWKHLPTLALPDGAHNYEEDTIYFHLPSLEDPHQTVYGISCYRQMNAQNLIRRSSDITRETVQKSVCVLSKVPLYGLIQAKLELITHAYFNERDFSQVSLLEKTFKNLNSSLPKDLTDGQQTFLGLSVRDFVLRFKHKVLLLFKLLLLEKKVLFYKAPVKNLCSTILTLCSLMPGMIEKGLNESAISLSSRSTPLLTINDTDEYIEVVYKENNNETCQDNIENFDQCSNISNLSAGLQDSLDCINHVSNSKNNNDTIPVISNKTGEKNDKSENIDQKCSNISRPKSLSTKKLGFVDSETSSKSSQNSSDTEGDSWVKVNHITPDIGSSATSITSSTGTETKVNDEDKLIHAINELLEGDDKTKLKNSSLEFQDDSSFVKQASHHQNASAVSDGISNVVSSLRGSKSTVLPTVSERIDESHEVRRWSASNSQNQKTFDVADSIQDSLSILDIESTECGLPLCIFTKGMLCHPYLSLPFLDILSDLSIRGYIVGATNILFRQKKHLFDVIIEVEDGKIEIVDPELKKQLHLTTEDLRFADHLVRHVMEDKQDVFLDGTGWEGGDEWLRSQFKLYLLSFMGISELEGSVKEAESFNLSFLNAWKATHNYKMWCSSNHSGIYNVQPSHPFQGQLSMADMKLKFSHTMQSSERGRRLNTAVVNTGKAVVQTGKAVGGAITSAKSVVSSWWSSFNVPQQQEKQEREEALQDSPAQENAV